jgi:dihydroflavonol-4-reductase
MSVPNKPVKKTTKKAAVKNNAGRKSSTTSTKISAKTSKKKPVGKRKEAKLKVVAVTGANGFLGTHLIEQLRHKHAGTSFLLRALVRRPSLRLKEAGVELVVGDVCEPGACSELLQGASEVYHLAGRVSRDSKDSSDLYRVHVDGTRNVLHAAHENGPMRILVSSSSGTVGVSREPDEVSDESSPYRRATVARWPYYLSKIYQEALSLDLAKRLNLDLVVVNPSLMLGPGDYRGSSTGDIDKVIRGHVPFIPRGGGIAFVDVRDAASGCILAMERGVSGECYLLSASNMTLDAYLGKVARLAGRSGPRSLAAPRTMKWLSQVTQGVCEGLNIDPVLDKASVEMAQYTWYVSADKAKRMLGWEHRDPAETLAETVRDLKSRRALSS